MGRDASTVADSASAQTERKMGPMKERAVVTGGSSGIGLALARLFVRDGGDVILVAHNASRLDEAARTLRDVAPDGSRVTTIAQDLSQAGAAAEHFAQLDGSAVAPTIVVNNAGFGLRGPFASSDR